jgi:phenylpyruvate tautomerase PptA (4-oxalocrotonate tautomerase family)
VPFVHVHTSRRPELAKRREFGAKLAKAYGEHMETTHRIVNVAFSFYNLGDIARYDAAGDAAHEMTVVMCAIRAGRAPDAIEALGRAFTSLCAEYLLIDPLRVAVYVNEHPAYQIYRDGGRAPDWSADERSGGSLGDR